MLKKGRRVGPDRGSPIRSSVPRLECDRGAEVRSLTLVKRAPSLSSPGLTPFRSLGYSLEDKQEGMVETGKLNKKSREKLRNTATGILAELQAENADDVACKIAGLILPDPKAAPNRAGLRVSREVIHEVAIIIQRTVRKREALGRLVDSLWRGGTDEARTTAAYCAGKLFQARTEEEETEMVSQVRRFLAEAKTPVVGDAFAESLSHHVEAGRGAHWMQAARTWAGDDTPRLRSFGPELYSHLFSRGESPEKLFDALQVAKQLIGDPDPDVRRAVRQLLLTSSRKQAPAIKRFLAKFEEDDRKVVQDLCKEFAKRLAAQHPPASPSE